MLKSPTRDSVLLRVLLSVHAFERKHELPEALQSDFGDAVRRHLVLPRPLGVDAYESSGDTSVARTAHLTLRANYAATLTADGRVMKASAIGGAHNEGFDAAILAAMQAVDSTDHLSLRNAGLRAEDVEIRVKIVAQDTTPGVRTAVLEPIVVTAFTATVSGIGDLSSPPKQHTPAFEPVPDDFEAQMPLFSFRVPVRAVTQRLAEVPGVGGLRFPSGLRGPGTKGQVQAAFVVNADGLAEPASVQFPYATQREFAQSVLDAMPKFRFRPLQVSGCPVRSLAELPFQFWAAAY